MNEKGRERESGKQSRKERVKSSLKEARHIKEIKRKRERQSGVNERKRERKTEVEEERSKGD